MRRDTDPLPSVEELEEALAVVAYIVLRHGDVYAPIMDRLQREVEEARRRVPSGDRARQILAALPMASARLRKALPNAQQTAQQS